MDELWRDNEEPYGDPKPVLELRGKTIASAQREDYITSERLVISFTDGTGLTIESFTSNEDSDLRIRVEPTDNARQRELEAERERTEDAEARAAEARDAMVKARRQRDDYGSAQSIEAVLRLEAEAERDTAQACLRTIRSWCDDPPDGWPSSWLPADEIASWIDADLTSTPEQQAGEGPSRGDEPQTAGHRKWCICVKCEAKRKEKSPHEAEEARCPECERPKDERYGLENKKKGIPGSCCNPFHDPAPTEPRSISKEQLDRLRSEQWPKPSEVRELVAAYEQIEERAATEEATYQSQQAWWKRAMQMEDERDSAQKQAERSEQIAGKLEASLNAARAEADNLREEVAEMNAVVRSAQEYIEDEFPDGAAQASEFETDYKALALIRALDALSTTHAVDQKPLREMIAQECDKRGLPHDFKLLIQHIANNHAAALGAERSSVEFLQTRIDSAKSEMEQALSERDQERQLVDTLVTVIEQAAPGDSSLRELVNAHRISATGSTTEGKRPRPEACPHREEHHTHMSVCPWCEYDPLTGKIADEEVSDDD